MAPIFLIVYNMQGKFVKNLVLLLVLNLLIKPFWILGIDRAVQNEVGAETYGFYFAVFNFSLLFNILLDFGITNFNNKNIAQNTQLLTKHLSNILILRVLLFFFYLLIALVVAIFIQYDRAQLNMLYLLMINQFLASFVLYMRSNLGGLHLFKTDSFISVLDRSLMILICAILLWGNVISGFKIQYYVYSQTVAYLITALVAFLLVLQHTQNKMLRIQWNFPFVLAILRKSLPYALLALLMTFYSRVDSVMLERMLDEGARQSGIYASAFRLLDAANMVAFLFAVLLLPIFARMIRQNEGVEELVKLSFTLLFVPACMVAISSWFYASSVMEWLYPIHAGEGAADFVYRIESSARVLGVLMTGFVAISTTYVFGTLLTARGSMRQMNLIALIGVILNVSLNILLIPRMQAAGSAWASMFTQFVVVVAQVLLVQRIFSMKVNTGLLMRMLGFVMGFVLIHMAIQASSIFWMWGLGLSVFVGIAFAFILGLIRPVHIYQLVRFGGS